jgi:hypothetical protein
VIRMIWGECAFTTGWLTISWRLFLKRSAGTYCPCDKFLLASFAPNQIVLVHYLAFVHYNTRKGKGRRLARKQTEACCGVGKILGNTSRAWSVL